MGRLNDEEEKADLFRHFSHDHPLQLSYNTSEAGQVICTGCNIPVLPRKAYYSCNSSCCFSLHSACYNMPRKIHHPAEPGHDLILLLSPSFACKACGKPGSGFAYNCRICHQNYHSLCTVLPLSASHCSHPHVLSLEFLPPYDGVKGFRCDICMNFGYDHWLYRCSPCGFDAHLECALSNQPAQVPQMMMSSDNRHCINQRSTNSNWVQLNQNSTNYVPANWQIRTNRLVHYVQPNGNQMVVINGQNQGGMMKQLMVGSAGSGMGQAIGQEAVHSVISTGLGNNGSAGSSSGKGDSDIVSSWVGVGANVL